MKSKKILVIIVIILCIVIGILIVKNKNEKNVKNNNDINNTINNSEESGYVEEIENGIKLNTSSKLNEAKEVDGYKISNIQLTTRDGITTLLADVTNISGKATQLKTIEITLLGENGEELTTVKGIISALDANESTKLNTSTTSDYIQAYDFKIEVK